MAWEPTQADLELAVGGARELRQLADPDGTGSPVASIVADYIDTATAQVRSAIEVKHDPEALAAMDTPSQRLLKDLASALAARTAYVKGGRGMAMPEYVEAAADRADETLDRIAKGLRRLGRVSGGTAAAINQPAASVDHDELGAGMSVAGFKKGFR